MCSSALAIRHSDPARFKLESWKQDIILNTYFIADSLTCYCDDCDVLTCVRDDVYVQVFPTKNHAEVFVRDAVMKPPKQLSMKVTKVTIRTTNFLLCLPHHRQCTRDAVTFEGVTREVVRIRSGPRYVCSFLTKVSHVWRICDNWGSRSHSNLRIFLGLLWDSLSLREFACFVLFWIKSNFVVVSLKTNQNSSKRGVSNCETKRNELDLICPKHMNNVKYYQFKMIKLFGLDWRSKSKTNN